MLIWEADRGLGGHGYADVETTIATLYISVCQWRGGGESDYEQRLGVMKREAQWTLKMTRMCDCDASDETLHELGSHGTKPDYTISQAIYYFSHLAEITPPFPGDCYTKFHISNGSEYMSKLNYTALGFCEDCESTSGVSYSSRGVEMNA